MLYYWYYAKQLHTRRQTSLLVLPPELFQCFPVWGNYRWVYLEQWNDWPQLIYSNFSPKKCWALFQSLAYHQIGESKTEFAQQVALNTRSVVTICTFQEIQLYFQFSRGPQNWVLEHFKYAAWNFCRLLCCSLILAINSVWRLLFRSVLPKVKLAYKHLVTKFLVQFLLHIKHWGLAATTFPGNMKLSTLIFFLWGYRHIRAAAPTHF